MCSLLNAIYKSSNSLPLNVCIIGVILLDCRALFLFFMNSLAKHVNNRQLQLFIYIIQIWRYKCLQISTTDLRSGKTI